MRSSTTLLTPKTYLGLDVPQLRSIYGVIPWAERVALGNFHSSLYVDRKDRNLDEMITILHQARTELRIQTIGPVGVAVGSGMVFDYFEALRKVIQTASKELFFIDRYLNADFVFDYLPHEKQSVSIRLLTSKRSSKILVPAVTKWVQQENAKIEVRSSADVHDRHVIVDQSACYQSGATFKDGPKNAPATITQITDTFTAVRGIYEQIWDNADIEFPRSGS